MHEAKTHLSRLVEAAARGESFVIARAGKPLVKVVAIEPERKLSREEWIGGMRGSGLGEWWDSLDHKALDKEIEELFLGSKSTASDDAPTR